MDPETSLPRQPGFLTLPRPPLTVRLTLGLLLVMCLCGLFAGLLAPYDYVDQDLRNRFVPPVGLGGDWAHPLGTDAPNPRLGMGLTRRAEPLVLRLEFLQFLRLLRNHSLQTGNLLAHAHNRVRAAVDTGGVQEPLQPCQLLLQLAQVPRTLAAAKLLQLRARRGKLLAVALEDPAQSVEFATGPDRFQLPFLATGFRFPELVFQCRDLGFRRLGTCMLPFVQTFQLLRRQGRQIDNIANRACGIQHAAGLTDVGNCCQKKMKPGNTAIKRRK